MTHADSTTTPATVPNAVPIAVLGTDALRAALPATPVQLAHACLRAGFANVVPASWGDELIATEVLRRLPQFGTGPVIQCSCPIVAHRLLTVGGDLRPLMLPLVAPPVAVSRYVRALAQPAHTRITYVGGCPGAIDESIDIRMTPDALIAMLAERQIRLDDQPRVFDSIIPSDRRRFRSQPGGVPTPDMLWTETGSRTLIEIDGEDLVSELAQHLLAGKSILIDASTRLGCVCAGAAAGVAPREARAQIVANEPPRSTTPVVEDVTAIELDSEVPAVSRTPIDISAVPHAVHSVYLLPQGNGTDLSFGQRNTPPRGGATATDVRPARASGPVSARLLASALPSMREVERRVLPRTFVARRKSPGRGIQVLLTSAESEVVQPPQPQIPSTPTVVSVVQPAAPVPAVPPVAVSERMTDAAPVNGEPRFSFPRTSAAAPTPSASWATPPRRVIVGFLAGLAIVIVLSVVAGTYIVRAFSPSPSTYVPSSVP